MKTMILATVAALSLGIGAAYAQGAPGANWTPPSYGTEWSAQHSVIGKNAVSHDQGQASNRSAAAPRG